MGIDGEIEGAEIKELCPNCGEEVGECACMRNKCIECGKPVGNITFAVCDDCWDTEWEDDYSGG